MLWYLLKKSSIKYKLLTFDELVINLDRLSRFKLPEYTYGRVFYSILEKCLISPKYSKKEFDTLNPKYIASLVKEIWNNSVKNYNKTSIKEDICNKALKMIIKKSFKNIEERNSIFINTNLLFSPILEKLDYNNIVFNLQFLKKVNEKIKNANSLNYEELINIRNKYKLKYPVTKILIVEGITEENLLPVFANKLNLNFDKNGIYILGAGGKSKSPSLYLELKNKVKMPIILLFDSDAIEICDYLNNILNKKDKSIIINNGEFEDIISLNLIKRTLNNEYKPASPLSKFDLHLHNKMCENIEHFYRTRHLGEFKKSRLSKLIAQNVKYKTDITNEIKNIIFNIV